MNPLGPYRSYYVPYRQSSNINDLLEKSDCTLEMLMDEEELVNEVRNINSKLMNFLDKSNVKKLIKYITVIPHESDDDKRCFKYPFVAAEIFNSDNSSLVDLFFSPNIESADKFERISKLSNLSDYDTPKHKNANLNSEEPQEKIEVQFQMENQIEEEEGSTNSEKNNDEEDPQTQEHQPQENSEESTDFEVVLANEQNSQEHNPQNDEKEEEKEENEEAIQEEEKQENEEPSPKEPDTNEAEEDQEEVVVVESSNENDNQPIEENKDEQDPLIEEETTVTLQDIENSTTLTTNDTVAAQVTTKYELLDALFSFLTNNQDEDVNHILAGYFNKCVTALFNRKAKELMQYVFSRYTIIHSMIKYCGCRSIGDLLIRFLNNEDYLINDSESTSPRGDLLNMDILPPNNVDLKSFGTIDEYLPMKVRAINDLICKMGKNNDDLGKINACQTLCDLVESKVLTGLFITDSIINQILDLSTNGDWVCLRCGLRLLITIFENDKFQKKLNKKDSNGDSDCQFISLLSETLKYFAKQLLTNPDDPNTFTTQYQRQIAPLGMGRIRIIEYLLALVKLQNPEILGKMRELKIPNILLNLVEEYETNSMLHFYVNGIFTFALESDSKILIDTFLTSSRLVDFLLKAGENPDFVYTNSGRTIRKPYMGFVTKMSNIIEKIGCDTDVKENMGSLPEWEVYVSSTLKETNDRDNQSLGGHSAYSQDDNDEDDSLSFDINLPNIYSRFSSYQQFSFGKLNNTLKDKINKQEQEDDEEEEDEEIKDFNQLEDEEEETDKNKDEEDDDDFQREEEEEKEDDDIVNLEMPQDEEEDSQKEQKYNLPDEIEDLQEEDENKQEEEEEEEETNPFENAIEEDLLLSNNSSISSQRNEVRKKNNARRYYDEEEEPEIDFEDPIENENKEDNEEKDDLFQKEEREEQEENDEREQDENQEIDQIDEQPIKLEEIILEESNNSENILAEEASYEIEKGFDDKSYWKLDLSYNLDELLDDYE